MVPPPAKGRADGSHLKAVFLVLLPLACSPGQRRVEHVSPPARRDKCTYQNLGNQVLLDQSVSDLVCLGDPFIIFFLFFSSPL